MWEAEGSQEIKWMVDVLQNRQRMVGRGRLAMRPCEQEVQKLAVVEIKSR